MKRRERALSLLKGYKKQDYHYLGEGFSGIVFHDDSYVYKVHIPLANDSYGESNGLSYLNEKLHVFQDSVHFYELNLFKIEGIPVLKYIYEEGEEVGRISENEYINFLAECWEKKVIFKSIAKDKNFIRTNGVLKFIDYEIIPYNDNLFLNCVARAFMYLKYPDLSEQEYNRMKRSLINNFDLVEIDGFDQFLNKVLTNITFKKSKIKENKKIIRNDNITEMSESYIWNLIRNGSYLSTTKTHTDYLNHELNVRFSVRSRRLQNTNKKITLLIKACPQDSGTIYQQVRHIVRQLSSPDQFYEKVIAIDKKERNFLREYSEEGSLEELIYKIKKLVDGEIIDHYIELPDEDVEAINERWFWLKTKETHTNSNIPVTPQIFAFEKVKGDYILQMDSDVLVGRSDYGHSYLSDMINALEENPNAVSVGFNIPKNKDVTFVDYHAPDGGYKPEVRFGLLHKEKLLKSRPWPNELVDGRLKYSWYQSLHIHQRKTGLVSLRGGDPRSYYIHPQNYRKKWGYNWSIIMDRIEKNIIPDIQREHFDIEGSLYDWTIPKRRERLVVLSIFEEKDDLKRFFRFFTSIVNQEFDDYGLMVINNNPDHLIDIILWDHLKRYSNVTYLHNFLTMKNMQNIYVGLHYFVDNPDSYVIIANPNDYFLGNDVFREIVERMDIYNADALIGKQINTSRLEDLGLFRVNFMKPRDVGSNTYYNIKAFKKKIFDSLSLYDMKKEKESKQTYNNFEKLSKRFEWFDDTENAALFSLLIEMSKNPIRFDNINYVIDSRNIIEEDVASSLEIIKDKTKKSYRNVVNEHRIDFAPNCKKIEIDITYDCDLKCIACNRSCTQVPSKNDNITINQIGGFIEESITMDKKWELINILGGEPTLHPNFLRIVELILNRYINKFSPNTVLQITSNAYSQKAKELLKRLPRSKNIVIDHYSFKDSKRIIYFTPFNMAPIDIEVFRDMDFKKGCWVTSYCGIGLNKYGYYPCGVAGSMDRVMGYDIGIKRLEDITREKLKKLLGRFCRYCGNMVDYDVNMGNFIPRCEKSAFSTNVVTESWESIYRRYHRKRPTLTQVYKKSKQD